MLSEYHSDSGMQGTKLIWIWVVMGSISSSMLMEIQGSLLEVTKAIVWPGWTKWVLPLMLAPKEYQLLPGLVLLFNLWDCFTAVSDLFRLWPIWVNIHMDLSISKEWRLSLANGRRRYLWILTTSSFWKISHHREATSMASTRTW